MTDTAMKPARLDAEARTEAEMPADRIFLTHYVRDIEIGAYDEEHGVTQRVRFDIVLEVARNTAHLDDSVGRVINYDALVDSIEALIAGPRINLLETFAERLAQRLLTDPRGRRVTIRLEKLDRLPGGGTLGCEITRMRLPAADERVWPLAPEAK
jgi:dihydroneopterin aldolase